MKLRRLILLLALVSVPFLQNVSIAQGDETKIIALENLWNQMQINHDADAMGKMLDSDFVLTDYDGTVFSKDQFLATIRDKSIQVTTEVSEDMKLHRHGDTVVVIGATHEKGTEKGKPFSHHGRFFIIRIRILEISLLTFLEVPIPAANSRRACGKIPSCDGAASQ